uniref:RxLR effector protein n=1 Tax=Chromera velia CCMP2878 TaxID=1169474 RepID=A0A0G4HHS2_9ALVE|mmetsp:Transcript_33099/g.65689  ORF Transcript_33099/g.65689 Transcript_33099/m.65689 type:complete len:120 (-) Transcript_33099:1207-1566(-)|eukprot:Cvel_27579.t1-p1 / transcript=Cvel_27579.t1 / gene=Cvel_27579 / organism=Chromera_velia_CCMP2878 / gene_product=hypothetical protein / transcript_product=hypothetical protein / location=Cvel_scaffold3469:5228-5584(+) / protein_length=119 / sequence_SO=supercontig / SO=protein_coding / is_pseudo=false
MKPTVLLVAAAFLCSGATAQKVMPQMPAEAGEFTSTKASAAVAPAVSSVWDAEPEAAEQRRLQSSVNPASSILSTLGNLLLGNVFSLVFNGVKDNLLRGSIAEAPQIVSLPEGDRQHRA